MRKDEFLERLENKLRDLDREEYEEALNYYKEYIEEAGEENEEEVLRKLGSPERVAAQIKAEVAASKLVEKEKNYKENINYEKASSSNSLNIILYIVLGILALPLALPLAATVFALLLTFLILIFTVLIVFIAIWLAIGIWGLGFTMAGLVVIFTDLYTGLFFIGMGLMGVSIFLIASIPVISGVKGTLKGVAILLKKLFYKIKGAIKNEKRI